jgi:hypothetical protein
MICPMIRAESNLPTWNGELDFDCGRAALGR